MTTTKSDDFLNRLGSISSPNSNLQSPISDLFGIANPTADVTVGTNGGTAYNANRKGEYFSYAVAVGNNVYPQVNVISTYGSKQTNTGRVFVPSATESYGYDNDGNLTSDGRWTYTWDGENRLIQMIRDTDTPSGARQKLVFEYDHQGRRIHKQFYTYSSGWVAQTNNIYLYDGWNLVGELDAANSNAKARTYVWGTDLSGSIQGAGGVGGLLKVTDYTSGTTHHFVAYDGNGNLAALVDGGTGGVTARYEYGPFGEQLRRTGTAIATNNPIRFSSKFTDNESGLLYYGYRFCNPTSGRWLSRDPMFATQAGTANRGARRSRPADANLYGFVSCSPISKIDRVGLAANDVAQVTAPAGVCPCKYGLRVDNLIDGILKDVDSAFGGLSDDQKSDACGNLILPPWAIDSWDMEGVTKGVPLLPSSKLYAPCAARVTYKGGCYDPAELNYLMFGHMCGLCDQFAREHASGSSWGSDLVEAIATLGKLLRRQPIGCAPDFAASGFNNTPTSCGNAHICVPNTKEPPLTPSTRRWRWQGVGD